MKGKQDRQRLIRQLVSENMVSSQEELSNLLEQHGLCVAQATLSRDIRGLRIAKMHGENGYFYRILQAEPVKSVHLDASISDSIESVEISGAMAVLKTRPGHAAMIASIVDENRLPQVMGTLAGDDTILLVLRSGSPEDEVFASLSLLFKGLDSKRIQ